MAALGEKVVFLCTHGIGDLIMTLPTVRLAAKAGFRIGLLVKGEAERQVAKELLPDIPFDCIGRHELPGGGVAKALRITSWIRQQKANWIFAQYGVNPMQFAVLAWLGGGRHRVGWVGRLSWLNSESLVPGGKHKVIETARYLDILGIPYRDDDLYWPDTGSANGRKVKTVLLAPGSGEMAVHRRWPAHNFGELASRLALDSEFQVGLIGGPNDQVLCEGIARDVGSPRVKSFAGSLSIGESLRMVGNSSVLVTNCNGISHLAATVGTSIVGLYGPTDPGLTGPFSKRFVPLSLGLECSPCYRIGYLSGCGNPLCMEELPVDAVYSAVVQQMKRGANRCTSPAHGPIVGDSGGV